MEGVNKRHRGADVKTRAGAIVTVRTPVQREGVGGRTERRQTGTGQSVSGVNSFPPGAKNPGGGRESNTPLVHA